MTAANISNWSFKLGSAASPQVLTAVEEVLDITGVGVENELIDVTNFDSAAGTKEYISGLADGAEFTVESNYIPNGAGQIVAMVAVDSQDTRLFEVRHTGTSPNKTFTGSVVCMGYEVVPSPTEQNRWQATFKITGALARA